MEPLTKRTTVKRHSERQVFDNQKLHDVLDAGWLCHVGFSIDGYVRVIPMIYARMENELVVHGSVASPAMRSFGAQESGSDLESEICVTVTHVDALVLARSVFNHTMNYRSAMVYGRPRMIRDEDEKFAALEAITESITPGQWSYARLPTSTEMKQTSVFALSLSEASVKIRTGPPGDSQSGDAMLPLWAGILPVTTNIGAGEPDPICTELLKTQKISLPEHIHSYTTVKKTAISD